MTSVEKRFVACIVGIVLVFTLMVSSCTVLQSYQTNVLENGQDNAAMVEMVKHGADPISARCAVKPSTSECAIIAARRQ